MAAKKKTWKEKLEDSRDFPKVSRIGPALSRRWGTGTFVIPAPREVDALMRRVGKGKLTTIDEMRKVLARRHRATVACPITTGIFAWIAAHAAAEAAAAGRRNTTPFWRTLKSGGEINPKYPGGIGFLKSKLRGEGHRVVPKGKRFVVVGFGERLADIGGKSRARPRRQSRTAATR